MKKQFAYVCFTIDDSYVPLLNVLIKSFESFSENHLFIYAIDFLPNRISSIIYRTNRVTIIPYDKDTTCSSMFNYKAKILTHFIKNQYADVGCYLDVDCVITPQCDSIFEKRNLITDCPISAVHPDNFKNNILDNLMKYLGVDKPTSPFIHNDLILFNNNTFNFMNTWADACISSNHITIWDEYVYNVILWKFNIKEDHFIQPIDVYFENFYSNAETRHTTYIYHGCKDPNTVQYLFNEMNKYYEHPLTVFEAKPFTKIRIGRDNDGGYVVADLHSYDLFLSAGIANDISFETEFSKKYNVNCYAFDGSINSLPDESNSTTIIFNKLNISNITDDKHTNFRNFFDSDKYNNMFIKMDIEGSEDNFFSTLTKNDLLKIKQLVVEVHKPESFVPYILSKTHYLIHLHSNNYGGVSIIDGVPIPSVYELTYVRKDCFIEKPNLNAQILPTFLDQRNGLYRPDGTTERPEIVLYCKPYVNVPILHPFIQTCYNSLIFVNNEWIYF